jgi:hypothetical protein
MSLSELEQHIFAYYVATAAKDLSMVPRYWPYGELVLIVEDRMRLAVRKFGVKAEMATPKVSRAYLDLMVERGGFSTTKDDLSTMHQYQAEAYGKCLAELQATDPLVLKAQSGGPTFWQDAFAAVGKS